MTKAFAKAPFNKEIAETFPLSLELVCPIDSPVALRSAVHSGADCVRIDHRWSGATRGFSNRDDRHLLAKVIRYAHDHQCNMSLDLSTCSAAIAWALLRDVVDAAAYSGIDAIVLADPALLLYVAARHPDLQLHYAVPHEASNMEAISCFQRYTGISRVVLPPTVSLAQIRQISAGASLDMEVVAFSRLCPAIKSFSARWRDARDTRQQAAWMVKRNPDITLPEDSMVIRCGSGEEASNDNCYTTIDLGNASVLRRLPDLATMRVRAIQIAAQDCTPARLAQIIRVWREAIDTCLEDLDHYSVKPSWMAELNGPPGLLRSS